MLPSRDSFLETGLVPVPTSTEECAICVDVSTSPVSLPCKHTFCKECIIQWLNQRLRNTCPYCRAQLFALDQRDNQPVGHDRMVVMAEAMQNAGLLGGQYARFSDDIHINISELYRAAAQANMWLGAENHALSTGPAMIERVRLGIHIIAMGNLLFGYAAASGRAYTAEQARQWKRLVKALYQAIVKLDGTRIDASLISEMLGSEMRAFLTESEDLAVVNGAFLDVVRPGTIVSDLNLLSRYLAKKCVEGFEAWEASRREARRGPTVVSQVSSLFRSLRL